MRTNKKSKPEIFTPKIIAVSLLFLSVFVVAFFFKTWCGVQCVRTGYEITKASNKQKNLMITQESLNIELAHLQSPEVLGHIAKDQLGLAIPGPDQVIILP